ncbi:unnamed protein product [Schistocephalus solidus]|uniref:Uncharacterized protein n=1 Tax=Schistocephalus solidus TaxID=70667 RepID=A0A183SR59_SCHSO|nr:unnamed protein product [Schistocephalus solidus]
MGLFGHMRIHDSGIHRNADNTLRSCHSYRHCHPTTMNEIPPASPDFSCPHCARNLTHASAWSVTCESIARMLVNQCLGLRHTVAAPTSTTFTAPAHLHTAWTY